MCKVISYSMTIMTIITLSFILTGLGVGMIEYAIERIPTIHYTSIGDTLTDIAGILIMSLGGLMTILSSILFGTCLWMRHKELDKEMDKPRPIAPETVIRQLPNETNLTRPIWVACNKCGYIFQNGRNNDVCPTCGDLT